MRVLTIVSLSVLFLGGSAQFKVLGTILGLGPSLFPSFVRGRGPAAPRRLLTRIRPAWTRIEAHGSPWADRPQAHSPGPADLPKSGSGPRRRRRRRRSPAHRGTSGVSAPCACGRPSKARDSEVGHSSPAPSSYAGSLSGSEPTGREHGAKVPSAPPLLSRPPNPHARAHSHAQAPARTRAPTHTHTHNIFGALAHTHRANL